MKNLFLLLAMAFGCSGFAQIITPSDVIYNRMNKVKEIVIHSRSEYNDFEPLTRTSYNRMGFVKEIEHLDPNAHYFTRFSYQIQEEDSTITVGIFEDHAGEVMDKVKMYKYEFHNGDLIESEVSANSGNGPTYTIYHYDANWNCTGKENIKVTDEDSTVVDEVDYWVKLDVRNRPVSSNMEEHNMPVYYYYDDTGKLNRRSQYDGKIKRSTEFRLYGEDGGLEMTIGIMHRTGALLGIKRYGIKNFWWSKEGIFEQWKAVAQPSAVIPGF